MALQVVADRCPHAQHILLMTDSQSLLRRLEGGFSPPEWWTFSGKIDWIFCPGHSGIALNEKADRLAAGSCTTSRINLSVSDIRGIIQHRHQLADAEREDGREIARMREGGLTRGWVRSSRRRGSSVRISGQLASGTISRRTLADLTTEGGAEAAWRRHFSRPACDAAADG